MRKRWGALTAIGALLVIFAIVRPRLSGRAGGGEDVGCGGGAEELSEEEGIEGEQSLVKEVEPIEVAIEERVAPEIKPVLIAGVGALRQLAEDKGLPDLQRFGFQRAERDPDGAVHTRIQQTLNGVPVFGGEAILHQAAGGEVTGVTDDLLPGVSLETAPTWTASAAIEAAKVAIECRECLTAPPAVDLQIIRVGETDHLTYRVSMRREDGTARTSMPIVFIDAHSGEEVFRYDNLQTATGQSIFHGTVTVGSTFYNSTYYLQDVTKKVGTFDFRNGTASAYNITEADDVFDLVTHRAALEAELTGETFLDYFLVAHGRSGVNGDGTNPGYSSINGSGQLLTSRVHYSTNYNNAFWNGSSLTYGDGDGTTFSAMTTLDIGAHEFTHALIERTAALVYSGESGALSESMADVFGAMVERHRDGESSDTWKLGEDAYTPGTSGDAFRYLDNPHSAANSGFTSDDDPDHYSERYTGTSDNGGVHINAGIPNKAFYLLAKGGSHHLGGSMTGIGTEPAARIWYRALTTYMTSSTNFSSARTATLNASNDLYGAGSTQSLAVQNAWCLVGVGSCPNAPPPPPSGSSNLITNGGFEGSASPWVPSGANAYYTGNGGYPHGGTGYIYFGNANSATGQTYQQFSIPSTATSANLTFWLNVTSEETTTTTQYDKLFVEVRNTAGTLLTTLATFSNLNKATAGSYTQRGSYSLLAYKGQTVRLQFRVTTDSSLYTTFRVDDVSVQ